MHLGASCATVAILVVSLTVGGCSADSTTGAGKSDARRVRVADCEGPATSLPAAIRAELGPRTGQAQPDDHWADLAETIPGGFAGVFYDDHKPVLMLTHPAQASAAKLALAADPGFRSFDIAHAEVRQARWDFAQLVDWYDYFAARTSVWDTPGMVSGDKDEVANRISYGIATEAGRQVLKDKLLALNVPCDLVQIELQSPIVDL